MLYTVGDVGGVVGWFIGYALCKKRDRWNLLTLTASLRPRHILCNMLCFLTRLHNVCVTIQQLRFNGSNESSASNHWRVALWPQCVVLICQIRGATCSGCCCLTYDKHALFTVLSLKVSVLLHWNAILTLFFVFKGCNVVNCRMTKSLLAS